MQLDTIISTIEQANPELQMYDAQSAAFTSYAEGAKAWEAPKVGAGFFMTPYNPSMWKADNSGGMNNMGTNGMGSFMIQGQQMIPNPAKLKANEKYMQSMSEVEIANKDYVKNDLFAQAKMNYAEWIILKKKLYVLDEQEQLMNYIIKTSEIRYPYQQEKLNSIYKAKAELAAIQNMRLMFESEISWKRVALNQLMNRDKSIQFDVDTSIVFKNYEAIRLDTTLLITNRSDLTAIEKNILVYKNKQQYENSRLKPDFEIQYGHMFSFGNNPNLFTLMGMVTIPIAPWSSKMYKSTALGINYEIQGYQKQKEAIINEASGMVESLQWRISSQKKQINIYENTMLPALQKNYKASVLAYEQNTEDLFVVLDAVQALQMAKMELLDKKQQLLLLQIEYEKTIEQK
ncbi:TolC family protein [Cytophaga hutchinsonii]|nr:TolC family protein [Cytophaga hutchinsonii]